MYQLATDSAIIAAGDPGRLFLESCSTTSATTSNVSLVHSAASYMRVALESDNLKPLSDFVGSSLGLGYELADVLAAAGQLVIDSLGDIPVSLLEKWMRRIAKLQRDVFPLDDFTGFSAEGFGSRAFAG
jgi:hypothetical protein